MTTPPYLPFEQARAQVRSLGFKTYKRWLKYMRRHRVPGIPLYPRVAYRDQWVSNSDWLGTTLYVRTEGVASFEDAREMVHALDLRSYKEWRAYAESPERPSFIPKNPHLRYAGKGWAGIRDWLNIQPEKPVYLRFEEARYLVRQLRIPNSTTWHQMSITLIPTGVPPEPHIYYEHDGWTSWKDWLGIEYWNPDLSVEEPVPVPVEPPPPPVVMLTYLEARQLVYQHRIVDWYAWLVWHKETQPANVPKFPKQFYQDAGWVSDFDWFWRPQLTTSRWRTVHGDALAAPVPEIVVLPALPPPRQRRKKYYLPFRKARAYAQSLKLATYREWMELAASKKLPADVPLNPRQYYANLGWISAKDWLGSEGRKRAKPTPPEYAFTPLNPPSISKHGYLVDPTPAPRKKRGAVTPAYLNYEQARALVLPLNIHSSMAWVKYRASNKLPPGVPGYPQQEYLNAGWVSWQDWLKGS